MKFNYKPVDIDIHPNELIDESDENRIIYQRSKNPVGYIMKDLIRAKLKVKNLGLHADSLYRKEIEFYQKKGYNFITIKDYCTIQKLI